jgi:hypothetical protein
VVFDAYQSEGIGNLADEDLDGLDTLRASELILTVLLESFFGLLGRQTSLGVGPKVLDNLFESQGVSRGRHWRVSLARDVTRQGVIPLLLGSHCCSSFPAVALARENREAGDFSQPLLSVPGIIRRIPL